MAYTNYNPFLLRHMSGKLKFFPTLLTFWQVYQFVTSSKMEVQISFSQGICVCLSNCNYLLILAMMTTLKIDLIQDKSAKLLNTKVME